MWFGGRLASEKTAQTSKTLIDLSAIHSERDRGMTRLLILDPGDKIVLDAAVHGQADAFITHNLQAAKQFSLTLSRPGKFLERARR